MHLGNLSAVALGGMLSLMQLEAYAQAGMVSFNNNALNRVFDAATGYPVEPGLLVAGLYYSTNLEAVAHPELPKDVFELAARTPISPFDNPALWGFYRGNYVELPGTAPGQSVLVQVRVWPTPYDSYEKALLDHSELAEVSNVIGPLNLGGGFLPPPSIAISGLEELWMPFPERNHAPRPQFETVEVPWNLPLVSGQLKAVDPEGDAVTFRLETLPTQGTVTIEADGHFTYQPLSGAMGTDSFVFKVNDGQLDSVAAMVTFFLTSPSSLPGYVRFENTSTNRILDGQTGLAVEPGVALAGLYFSTNLLAVPNYQGPNDPFQWVNTRSINLSEGRFSGGNIRIPGALQGQAVLFQVRVWPSQFDTFEMAFADPEGVVAISDVIGPVVLGGQDVPIPSLSESPQWKQMTLASMRGRRPPLAQTGDFTIRANHLLRGQLIGSDLDGDPITFSLLTSPSLGTLSLQPDGQFEYLAAPDSLGLDQFQFKVSDGVLDSGPTTVLITVLSEYAGGELVFRNAALSQIVDGRTGMTVKAGTAWAGLFVCANLNALPRPGQTDDPFVWAYTTLVDKSPGLFDGGTLEIAGTSPGQPVLVQVRIWPVGFTSFEAAFANSNEVAALSDVIGPLTLGGDNDPVPSLEESPELRTLTLLYHQGVHPPVTKDQNYYLDLYFRNAMTNQLSGRDPDGDALTFALLSPPRMGSVEVYPDGRFIYRPSPGTAGFDSFSYIATDGVLISQPGVIHLSVLSFAGYITFYGPPGSIIDGRTGLPIKPDLAVAGLYYTKNLDAVAHPELPRDDFKLAATAPIGRESYPVTYGAFYGGDVLIPESTDYHALLQVRVWSVPFASYEEAYSNHSAILSVSDVMGPVYLSFGTAPTRNLSQVGFTNVTVQVGQRNHAPEPFIQVFPLFDLAGNGAVDLIICSNNTNATVVLDGSLSSDPENDPLQFSWMENSAVVPFGSGPTVVQVFALGRHRVTLLVDDGTDTALAETEFEVISAGTAVQELIRQVGESALSNNRKKPLASILSAAASSFDRGQFKSGLNQLHAFENMVRAQVETKNPEWAGRSLEAVRLISQAFR